MPTDRWAGHEHWNPLLPWLRLGEAVAGQLSKSIDQSISRCAMPGSDQVAACALITSPRMQDFGPPGPRD